MKSAATTRDAATRPPRLFLPSSAMDVRTAWVMAISHHPSSLSSDDERRAGWNAGAPKLRRDLEHRSEVVSAAGPSCAVEMACGIPDQTAICSETVPTPGEVVQLLFRPAAVPNGCQLEHRAIVMTASSGGRPVEVAGGVEDQVGIGHGSVQVVAEVTQPRRLLPIAVLVTRQLKRCASAISAARRSRAVEMPAASKIRLPAGEAPSAPLGLKLCSTFSVHPPPCPGDNSNTVPES